MVSRHEAASTREPEAHASTVDATCPPAEEVTERQSFNVRLWLSWILYAYRDNLSGLAMEPAGFVPGGFLRCAGPKPRVQLFFDWESTLYLMRRRLRLLMSVRTATRNLDLQLAIATLRLSGERESDQSRAKQHDTSNGHSQETVRSELLTHRAPPNRVRPARSERRP